MKRLSALLLSLLLLASPGCGGSTSDFTATNINQSQAINGRALVSSLVGNDVVQAIDNLPIAQQNLVYNTVAQWSDSNPTLTGNRNEALDALGVIVRNQAFGADGTSRLLQALQPDTGQAFLLSLGRTLNSGRADAQARSQDAFRAATSQIVPQTVNPVVIANLAPEISSLAEFQGLRILAPEFLPSGKRAGVQKVRLTIPTAANGVTIRKIMKVSDLESYLSGEFDPEVSGFVAVANQVEFLQTSAQLIEGLRLDYPGGLAGDTEVGELTFPKTSDFSIFVPFSNPLGGTVDGEYPFTGTGFTSSLNPLIVPEFHMMLGSRTPLPVGAELAVIDQNGQRTLRGTLNAQGQWVLNQSVLNTAPPRQRVGRPALYQGVPVWVSSSDGTNFWVSCEHTSNPGTLLGQSRQIGRRIHLGIVGVTDPGLVF